MEEQTIVSNDLDEIKKQLKTGKLVFGFEKSIKLLKLGKISRIYVSSNIDAARDEDLIRYSGIAGIELARLKMPNDELGIFCKRPHSISVIGLLK